MSTPGAKKVPEKRGGGFALPGFGLKDFWPVMAGRLVEEARSAEYGSAFRVRGRKDNPGNPRQGDRTGAHRAGLERHEQRRANQPFIAQRCASLPDDLNFCMGRGVMALDDPVAVRSEHCLAVCCNQDGTHGHLVPRSRLARFG